MPYLTRIYIIALLLITGTTAQNALLPKTAHAMEDAIIAVVNDELITLRDLQNYIQTTLASLATRGMPRDQIERVAADLKVNGINKLIEDRLILSKANQIGLEINEEILDKRIREIKSGYSTEQEFTDALILNGATVSDLRSKITSELKIQYIIENEVKSKVFVNPQEVTDYYNKYPERFIKKEKVELDSIFINIQDGDDTIANERMQRVLTQLEEGKSFEKVSKIFSDSPAIGVVEKGQILKTIEDTVFTLEVNEISEIVKLDTGLYLFKLLNKFPAESASLHEVKNNINNLLHHEKFRQSYRSWVEKLKEEAYVEIK